MRSVGGSPVAAAAEVAAVATRRGVRLATLRSEPPLVLRRSATDTVHLVSVGGGPVAGDRLHLRLRVERGARLHVRQTAASIALPAPRPSGPSRLRVEATIAAGGLLTWAGEPTVAARGCDHRVELRADLEGDAELCWREEAVGGRFGEPGGRLETHLDLRRDGVPLVRTTTVMGDGHWASPGAGGGARVVGTWLGAGRPAGDASVVPSEGTGVRAALHRPADGVALLTVLGDEHPPVRQLLERVRGAHFGVAVAAQ